MILQFLLQRARGFSVDVFEWHRVNQRLRGMNVWMREHSRPRASWTYKYQIVLSGFRCSFSCRNRNRVQPQSIKSPTIYNMSQELTFFVISNMPCDNLIDVTRDTTNSRSRSRNDLLAQARSLIISAQLLGTENPADLLSIQQGIEWALRSERRARRYRQPIGGERLMESEQSRSVEAPNVATDESTTATNEAEAEVEPAVDTPDSSDEEPSEIIRVTELIGLLPEMVGVASW